MPGSTHWDCLDRSDTPHRVQAVYVRLGAQGRCVKWCWMCLACGMRWAAFWRFGPCHGARWMTADALPDPPRKRRSADAHPL